MGRGQVLSLVALTLGVGLSPMSHPTVAQTSPPLTIAEVLEAGRAALGGASVVDAVRELEMEVDVARRSGVTSSMLYQFALPDRFLQVGTMDLFPGRRVFRGVNAGRLIARTEGWTEATSTPNQRRAIVSNLGQHATRLLASFLLSDRTPVPVQYAYLGRTESKDRAADTVRVTGPDGFDMLLYLDAVTHLPLMASHQVPAPGSLQVERSGDGEAVHVKRDPTAAQTVEERWIFSKQAREGGMLVPRSVVVTTAGETTEQWTVRQVRVNPGFPSDRFKVE